MFSRKKLVERKVILDQNDIPRLRPGQEAEIITILPNGDQFTSKYKARNDPTGAKFTDVVNAHLRLDQAQPPYQFQQSYLPPQLQQPNGALGQPNSYATPVLPPFQPQNRPYFKIRAPTHQDILLAANSLQPSSCRLGHRVCNHWRVCGASIWRKSANQVPRYPPHTGCHGQWVVHTANHSSPLRAQPWHSRNHRSRPIWAAR